MTTKTRTAFCIGVLNEQEHALLAALQAEHNVHVIDNVARVYQRLAHYIPDVVVFAAGQTDTTTLKLFRQLRRLKNTTVIVPEGAELKGFSGSKYQRRRSAANSQEGLRSLLDWSARLSAVQEADHRYHMWLSNPLTRGVEPGAAADGHRSPAARSAQGASVDNLFLKVVQPLSRHAYVLVHLSWVLWAWKRMS